MGLTKEEANPWLAKDPLADLNRAAKKLDALPPPPPMEALPVQAPMIMMQQPQAPAITT